MDVELPVLSDEEAKTPSESIAGATILFAGDSGDGMQLAGSQFTMATAHAQNDLATLPDYPAEIRAPAGTTYGVSAFQIRFGSREVRTPGSQVDMLVAMNPAALQVHLNRVHDGGAVVVNKNTFNERGLELAGYETNPLEDGSLDSYDVIPIELTRLTREALKDSPLSQKQVDRSKNMFALGLALWIYSRPLSSAETWISKKFEDKPEILEANLHVLKKGYHYGETTDLFTTRYQVHEADLPPGTYRTVRGAEALALGLVAASQKSGLRLFYGSYPITPASDLLHELSKRKDFGVITLQAEDEIAAASSALGAAFGGNLGVTATSGPGLALKTETIGLALMSELPMVIIDMQRGGPSTGLPTKTEQSDLLQALYGRNGDAPLPVIAPSSPADCFEVAFEACRIATQFMTPVILLADGYLGNGSEPWRIPDPADLPNLEVGFAEKTNGQNDEGDASFLPYVRDERQVRPWAKPGTPELEHRLGGLEKEHETGNVSYDPANHELMTRLRAQKIENVAAQAEPLTVQGPESGDLLIVGWGSTKGAIEEGAERARQQGHSVSNVHLRYVWPLPRDLADLVDRFDRVLVPELNNGQLVRILRDRFERPFVPLNKIQGQPFQAREIEDKIDELMAS